MRVIRSVAELRDFVRHARGAGCTVGLVPTMGALHAGHLSLITASSQRGHDHVTIVSSFVNPRQFGDSGDLAAYPKTEQQDIALAEEAGAEVLFVPTVDEVYPTGFATEVRISGDLTSRLEGAHRGAAHFHGVTTVVTKLLNMVQPDVAFFGAKDAQQALVVQRLVTDLNLPVEISVQPTIRETDGLAMSSRNVRLSADERVVAAAIPAALSAAAAIAFSGEHDVATIVAAATEKLRAAGLTAEYLTVVDPETLRDRTALDGRSLLVAAVPVGPVRLLDNVVLEPTAAPSSSPSHQTVVTEG
ncbi:MAG: pantoate--beta-alanine ligase [Patulibacter sp.]